MKFLLVEFFYEYGVGVLGNVYSILRCSRDGLSLNLSVLDEVVGFERDKGFMEWVVVNILFFYLIEYFYVGLKYELFFGYFLVFISFGGESEVCLGFMEWVVVNVLFLFLRE